MMKDAKLYVGTDIDIIMTIDNSENEVGDIDLLMSDIVSLGVTLTLSGNDQISQIFIGENNVSIQADKIVLSIPKEPESGISIAGVYNIRIVFVDENGKERGLTPSPDFLEFHA